VSKQDRVRKIENLKARAGSAGEQQAAARALVRIGPGDKALAAAKADGLTDAIVKRLSLPAQGNRVVYDAALPGFGVRLTAGGFRSFILNYRVRASGQERRYTIGGFPNWHTGDARRKARELKRLIDDGGDPLADIEAERGAPTVAELCDRFEQEHLPRKRSGTAADYKRILASHIRPHFGRHVRVADVTTDSVEQLHRKISGRGHLQRANRVVAVLSKMFSLAARWGYRETNPCKGIERNPEVARKRYLSGEELAQLTAALAKHPDRQQANVFRLLLLTGARRGEVLAMKWADLDLGAGKWVKPGSTTKQKTEHEAFLSAPARQLLGEMRAAQEAKASKRKPLGEYVFPGNGSIAHVTQIKRAWRSICKAAAITKPLRIHDLRHSFASELVSSGASLPLIGALLGHSNPATTHRYAHLFDDPQRAAVERVGERITAAAAEQPGKQPTPLKRRTKRRA
jgi:integrase